MLRAAFFALQCGVLMIVILNGPLGIGKSTLAEALTESIESCVMLEGDRTLAMNPPPIGEPLDVSAAPSTLVNQLRDRLGS